MIVTSLPIVTGMQIPPPSPDGAGNDIFCRFFDSRASAPDNRSTDDIPPGDALNIVADAAAIGGALPVCVQPTPTITLKMPMDTASYAIPSDDDVIDLSQPAPVPDGAPRVPLQAKDAGIADGRTATKVPPLDPASSAFANAPSPADIPDVGTAPGPTVTQPKPRDAGAPHPASDPNLCPPPALNIVDSAPAAGRSANPAPAQTTAAQRLWGMMGHRSPLQVSPGAAVVSVAATPIADPAPDTKNDLQTDATMLEKAAIAPQNQILVPQSRPISQTDASTAKPDKMADPGWDAKINELVPDKTEPAVIPDGPAVSPDQNPARPSADITLIPLPPLTGTDAFSLPLAQIGVIADGPVGGRGVAAPPLSAPMPQPFLASVMAEAAQPRPDGVSLTLAPEELGRLQMTIQTSGDQLTLAIAADRPETLDLLRRHADQLSQELRQAGFAQPTLSFSQGNAQGFARPDPQSATPPRPARTDPDFAPIGQVSPPGITHHGHQAGLDLRL